MAYIPLTPLPLQYQDAVTSRNLSGGSIEFFLAGTNTPTPLFSDPAGTSIGTSITLNSGGMPESGGNVITLFRDDSIALKLVLKNAAGATISTSPSLAAAALPADLSAVPFYVTTTAETAAGVTPSATQYAPGDIRRYGAVAAANNTAAIQAAVDSATAGDTVRLTVAGQISTEIHIETDDIVIDGCGRAQSLTVAAATSVGHDWSPYTQMFVADADRVFFRNMKCTGTIATATSRYFGGSFIWFALSAQGGGVQDSYFENLGYVSGSNNVAIQVRNNAVGVHIHSNLFKNCAGSVSHQGAHGSIHHCTAQITDAAAATPLTDTAGVFDQPFGIDGSTGNSLHHCKVFLSSAAPYSGSLLGANSGTDNFQIHSNEIYGLRGGVALFIRESTNGTLYDNVIDGLGYTSAAAWCFLRVDADSSGVNVHDNVLRGPLVNGVGTGLGMDIYTGGNFCHNNRVLFSTSTAATSLLQIKKGTTPAESVFDSNYLQGGGVGTKLDLADNILTSTGFEQPIIHRNNTFASPITTPYSCTGAARNIKFYIENDRIVSSAYNASAVVLTPKFNRMFTAGAAANFPFSVGLNIDIRGAEVPSGANYYLATYETADVIYNSATAAAGSEGWKCTTAGTIPDGTPYSQAGVSTSGSPIITGLANTTLVLVGDYVSPSAGFATTGPYKVIAKAATTLTLNVNSNGNNTPTVTHFAPVFKAMAAVAA